MLPWLSLNKAPTLPRYRCHVAVVTHTVVVAKPRFALVVDLRFTLIVTTVASLQGLEQLSTAAAVLLCTGIALLLDVLAVVVVLPYRAATIIVAHCNAATVLSTRRSPFTVIGLHQLFVASISRPAGALSPSRSHCSSSTMWLRRFHANSSTQRHDHGSSTMVLFLLSWFYGPRIGITMGVALFTVLPVGITNFVSTMGALARNFASVVLLLWWSFSRNFTTSCATVVIHGLLRDPFPHDLAVIALQPRHATMGFFPDLCPWCFSFFLAIRHPCLAHHGSLTTSCHSFHCCPLASWFFNQTHSAISFNVVSRVLFTVSFGAQDSFRTLS